jgi:hypothetical protein
MDAITGTNPPATSVAGGAAKGPITWNPDAAQIDRPAVQGAVRRRGFAETARAVGTGQPDRRNACRRERRNETGVDGPSQDGDHDVQRRVVGDSKTVDLPLLDARRRERRIDFLAPSVDDDQRRAGIRPRA